MRISSRFIIFITTVIMVSGGTSARAQDTTVKEAPKWERLKAAYDYEKAPQGKPLSVVEEDREATSVSGVPLTQTHLKFTNSAGHTVTGLVIRPTADPVEGKAYPAVVLLHGMTSSKEAMIQGFGRYFAAKGFVCLALDAVRHGERRELGKERAVFGKDFFDLTRETVMDYRLALDWFTARKDVDKMRIGAFGYSMGAMMAAILGGVDERIRAATLCVGGDPVITSLDGLPEPARFQGQTSAASLYIGHFAPRPLLMVNGKDDRVILRPVAERLQEAARNPKEIRWVSGGHGLPAEAVRNAMDWLIEKLTAGPLPTG